MTSRGRDWRAHGVWRLMVAAVLIGGALLAAASAIASSSRAQRRANDLVAVVPTAHAPAQATPFAAGRSALPAATGAEISTYAGGVDAGPNPATSIGIEPDAVSTWHGNVFVTDPAMNVVRKITGQGIQTVVAGDSGWGVEAGDGGLATAAGLNNPFGTVEDSAGDVFIADGNNGRVRMVAAASCSSACPLGLPSTVAHHIYTVAGGGSSLGDGGPATSAALSAPAAAAFDSRGDLLIADGNNGRVRLVAGSACSSACPFGLASMTEGDIYTVAGGGTAGLGDGGPATSAQLQGPAGLAFDAQGDLLIAEERGNRIRLVAAGPCSSGCPYGLSSTTANDIYTIAGNGTAGYTGDSGPAASAELNYPDGIAVDGHGNLLIADYNNSVVRLVANVSCASNCPYSMTSTTAGDIYTAAGGGGSLQNGVAPTQAMLANPTSVAVDSSGNLVISDTYDLFVRIVAAKSCASSCAYGLSSTAAGDIYTIGGNYEQGYGGDGGPRASSEMSFPSGLIYDAHGDLLIADTDDNRIRMVAAATCSSSCAYGLTSTIGGHIYTIAGNGSAFSPPPASGVPAITNTLWQPNGLAVNARGDLLISDSSNSLIRLIAGSACASACPFGLASMTEGYIYTVAGNGTAGYSGDGGPGASAAVYFPQGVAVDPSGDVLIADTFNNRVRIVANATCSSTCPYGFASMTAGDIYTLAGSATAGFAGDGGPATSAQMHWPSGVGVDAKGNLLLVDAGNYRVRMVALSNCASACGYGLASTVAGDIYTVAGNGSSADSGDGGPATSAGLSVTASVAWPSDVVVDRHGDLLITTQNGHVRMVAAASCSSACPYGLPSATAHDIYTVAGGGTAGIGDNGPATAADLVFPSALAIAPNGDLMVADTKQNRIRVVAVPPKNTALPVISGTPQSGTTLTTSTGSWTAPSALTYADQWERCSSTGTACAWITGATASSYAVTSADIGHTITVVVIATDREGQSTRATAKPVGPVTS